MVAIKGVQKILNDKALKNSEEMIIYTECGWFYLAPINWPLIFSLVVAIVVGVVNFVIKRRLYSMGIFQRFKSEANEASIVM